VDHHPGLPEVIRAGIARRFDPSRRSPLETKMLLGPISDQEIEIASGDLFFCGGGKTGKVRAVRRPKRGSATGSGSRIPVDSTRK
jgi:hypothetical protein